MEVCVCVLAEKIVELTCSCVFASAEPLNAAWPQPGHNGHLAAQWWVFTRSLVWPRFFVFIFILFYFFIFFESGFWSRLPAARSGGEITLQCCLRVSALDTSPQHNFWATHGILSHFPLQKKEIPPKFATPFHFAFFLEFLHVSSLAILSILNFLTPQKCWHQFCQILRNLFGLLVPHLVLGEQGATQCHQAF